MVFDTYTYELIDRYLSGELEGKELSLFLGRLRSDSLLREEMEMMREVDDAICEKDVTGLRTTLSQIISEQTLQESVFFGLAEEIDKISDLQMEEDEIGSLGNSIHRLHLKNHQRSHRETVHDLYTKKEEEKPVSDNMMLSEEDEQLFKEIEKAVSEREIMELRSNLEAISKHMPSHNICAEKIEQYASGEMSRDEAGLMQRQAASDSSLASDIQLHQEIDKAISENEIMELRSTLQHISRSEVSHSRTADQIEMYLHNELDQNSAASFEEELAINPGLARDVTLHRETEEAVAEKDIINLRASLQRIRQENKETRKVRRGITLPAAHRLAWYAAAASVVLVLSIAGVIKNRSYTEKDIYTQYYAPYKGAGTFRSATTGAYLTESQAMTHFKRGEYDRALTLFNRILEENENNPAVNFYSGAIYQDKKMYRRAISSYTKVVEQKDNLLVEQAAWYIALCHLQQDERKKALERFRQIASQGGYYARRAEEIIEKLE